MKTKTLVIIFVLLLLGVGIQRAPFTRNKTAGQSGTISSTVATDTLSVAVLSASNLGQGAFIYDTTKYLTTANAALTYFPTAGSTILSVSVAQLTAAGTVSFPSTAAVTTTLNGWLVGSTTTGLVLTSPNGSKFIMSATNGGTVQLTAH